MESIEVQSGAQSGDKPGRNGECGREEDGRRECWLCAGRGDSRRRLESVRMGSLAALGLAHLVLCGGWINGFVRTRSIQGDWFPLFCILLLPSFKNLSYVSYLPSYFVQTPEWLSSPFDRSVSHAVRGFLSHALNQHIF